jgi:alpha-1,2-glucosyltransferase
MTDYLLLLTTVLLAAVRKPFIVLRASLPYLALFGLFAGFVAWNGGVVLGKAVAATMTSDSVETNVVR